MPLPIRKAVLFKHGIGYFERQTEVDGDESLDLHFKAAEMNDVLKSLTVLDLTDGHISSISYESTLPTEKRLEDVALRLPDGSALSGLIEQVKGARVRIRVGSEELTGSVAGLETKWVRFDKETHHRHELVLSEGGTLKSFALEEIKSFTFLEDGLKKDLEHLLEVLIGAKKKDQKRLTIFARGRGKRPILASYVVETPVWKTSYRVLMSNDELRIQGWALVDNTQDEDWDDVSLTLVAGLPVSFVHDLYSPRHRRRPVVEVREEEAYAPPILEETLGMAEADEEVQTRVTSAYAPPPAMARAAPGMPPPPRSFGALSPAPAQLSAARERSADVQTRTVQVGDLFQYVIDKPVTVKRNQSALVPILSAKISGKRVAIYNSEIRDKNPMSALRLENTTGLTLEGGPLTVLEDESYVGESMLETLKPDDHRLVPYSVELGCVVSRDHKSDVREVFHARIVNGVLWLTRHLLEKTIYSIVNKNEKSIDLFLEHRFNKGWDLIETPKPVETTESFYRFRLPVPAKQTTTFTVLERGQRYENFQIANVSRDQIKLWVDSRYIDAPTQAVLSEVIALNDQIARLGHEIAARERDVAVIHQNQGRIRENLGSLGQSRDELKLRERYVAELSRDEDVLAELATAVTRAQTEKAELETALRARIASLSFARDVSS